MRKSKNYWTKEKSFEVALQYNNKRDFKKDHISAYELLRINNWLDDACLHMSRPKNDNIKWTFDECKNEALNYKTLKEFRLKRGGAYRIARQNNWLNEVCSHMAKNEYKKQIIWTFENCYNDALKYNTRIEFCRKSRAYGACRRNGWLNEVCKHMEKPYASKFKWSKERCLLLALNYNTRAEFKSNEYNAYNAAKYNGWLDEICKDMVRCGDRKHKCIYSYEFSDNYVYVGLTYNLDIRDRSRKYKNNDAVTKHRNDSGLVPIRKQLTEYVPVNIAINLEGEYLEKYINEGWFILNKCKTGSIGGYNTVWNYNRVKSIVSKYEDLESLILNDKYLYEIIKNKGWVNSLFPIEI